MSFQLIQPDTFYKLVEVTGESGQWVNGIWVPDSTPTPTYEPFTGTEEPFQQGETSLVLPEGVTSDKAIVLYSETKLNTFSSVNPSLADTIYLEDPSVNPSTQAYIVRDVEDWRVNTGFKLFVSQWVYLCVRENFT